MRDGIMRLLLVSALVGIASAPSRAQVCAPVHVGPTGIPNLGLGLPYTATSFDDGVNGPRFYVGGNLASMMGSVAVLTPSGWQGVGVGVLGTVYALESLEDGLGPGGGPSLYAGSTGGLHRWTGTQWTSIGPSPGWVFAVVMFDDGQGGGPSIHVVTDSKLLRRSPAGLWEQRGTLAFADPKRLVQRVVVFDEDGPGPLPPSLYIASGVNSASPSATGGTVTPASGLVRWDGQAFFAMSDSFAGATSMTLPYQKWIKAAAVFDDGAGPALYISGHASPGNTIARWNSPAQRWDPVGQLLTTSSWGTAYGLVVLNDSLGPVGQRLYAFTGNGELFAHLQPAGTAMAWDGVSWTAVRGFAHQQVTYTNYHLGAAAGVVGAARIPGLLIGAASVTVGFAACPRCRGDVNLDGVMNGADRAVISANMGMFSKFWSGGDLDGNNVVDAADMALVCDGDFNCDGEPTVGDIFDFLNAWLAGDRRADFDLVGGLTVADIFAFLNAWFAGCP